MPVENPTVHQQVLQQIMVANLNDEAQSWLLDAEGAYHRTPGWNRKGAFSAHEYFMTNPSLSGRGHKVKDLPRAFEHVGSETLGLADCDAAVIDVGSNSVRLVLYRLEGRAIWTVFNEKVLGRPRPRPAPAPAGCRPAASKPPWRALRRFARPARRPAAPRGLRRRHRRRPRGARRPTLLPAGGTRDRPRASRALPARRRRATRRWACSPARPIREGVVGDLGGASLELIRLANGGPTEGVSLPLGPFAWSTRPVRADADASRRQSLQSLATLAEHFRAETLQRRRRRVAEPRPAAHADVDLSA